MNTIGPQAFRWRLAGHPLPPLTAALRVGTAARAAVYRGAGVQGLLPLPDSFHGGAGDTHTHAFWLTEDADDDGLIDHVLLFAASGLPYPLLPVLAGQLRLELTDLGRWHLYPDWMGQRVPGALFGPARQWASSTAYVPPLDCDRPGADAQSLNPANQLRWEVGMRRLGPRLAGDVVVAADILRGGRAIAAASFVLKARRLAAIARGRSAPEHWQPPVNAKPVGATLTFVHPVWGPLAFGYGAHFGLGLFEPVG